MLQRSGFASLTVIAIIIGGLLVTGVGQYLWRNALQIGYVCRDIVLSVDFHAGLDTCDAISQSLVFMQRSLEQRLGMSQYGDSMDLEQFSAFLARSFTSATLGYNSPHLASMFQQMDMRSNPFSTALHQGRSGWQQFQSGNQHAGLGQLHQSAGMGEGGLFSQLQLGAIYSQGTTNIPRDPSKASYFYQQAAESLRQLQQSNQPQAQAVLQSLPISPEQLSQQLRHLQTQ